MLIFSKIAILCNLLIFNIFPFFHFSYIYRYRTEYGKMKIHSPKNTIGKGGVASATPLPLPMCVYVFHDLRNWVIFCIFAAMKHEESKLQKHCVMYFRLAYPQYAGVFFAVPNGGSRNSIEASRLKAEGVLAGVADLLLLVPNGQYNCLAIEMKTDIGRQSERQKEFETALTSNGGKYVVCRSFDDFKNEICKYLNYNNLK